MNDELSFELEAECQHCDYKEQIYVRECDYDAWHNGEFIQDVMSYLSAAQRELMISGTCDSCWQKFFPDDEVDE
tara:strand:- start:334 stop:555 length:222 start_codon:yes stop_codon:yes gene_type:complete